MSNCQKDVKCQKVKHIDYGGGSQKKINWHNEVHTYWHQFWHHIFWQIHCYFTLEGCGGPGMRTTITVIVWRIFHFGRVCGFYEEIRLATLHPCSLLIIGLKWMRFYRLQVLLTTCLPVLWLASAMFPPTAMRSWTWRLVLLLPLHNCFCEFHFGRMWWSWQQIVHFGKV